MKENVIWFYTERRHLSSSDHLLMKEWIEEKYDEIKRRYLKSDYSKDVLGILGHFIRENPEPTEEVWIVLLDICCSEFGLFYMDIFYKYKDAKKLSDLTTEYLTYTYNDFIYVLSSKENNDSTNDSTNDVEETLYEGGPTLSKGS